MRKGVMRDVEGLERNRMFHQWHVALNGYKPDDGMAPSWMYEAKRAVAESKRLALLFSMERQGKLPAVHRQCSHSADEAIADNRLTCCLGVECRACPELLALDKTVGVSSEFIDEAKAWTCVSHILHTRGGGWVDTSEGYVLTTGDHMFWERVYENLSMPDGSEDAATQGDGDEG